MSERISVTITAQDGASKTFTAIGNSAQKMGDQIESAGKEGTAGLKTIDTQAKSTGQSMEDIKAKATALGAAFGVMVSAAALLGTSYRDQQRQIDGINRLYGDQADEILALTEQIQEYTKFSNDAAREGALVASSLATNYDLTADQIGVLIERSADLAQIFGMSLPDAIQRTAGAIRGEGEAAERLGLNMSDAAIAARALDEGITNWNVPGALTEAEKAAFRFQVFLEDTAATTGAAADAAEGAGGQFRQFANELQDAGQSVGGFLGPIGEVAAEMAPLAIAAPVVGAGLARMGAAFASTAIGARTLSVAMIGMRAAMGPIGIIIAGVVAVGGLLVSSWLDQKQAADQYNDSLSTLDDTLEMVRRRGDTALADLAQGTRDMVDEFTSADRAIEDLGVMFTPGSEEAQAIDEQARAIDALKDEAAYATPVLEKFTEALNDPNVDANAFFDWANGLLEAAAATETATDDLEALTTILNRPLSDFSTNIDSVTDSVTALSDSFGLLTIDTYGQIRAAQDANREYAELTKNVEAFEDATQDFLGNGDNILDFWLQYQENLKATQAEYARLKAEAFEAGTPIPEAMQDTVSATEAAFEATVRLADALSDAGNNLDSVLRTYQQIDDLGQRSAAAGSIADNLIGAPGELGTVQDLWDRITAGTADAALTADQYNDALNAGVAIQQSNLRVQDDLTAMRAAQLPLLAEEQAAYEAQIEAISQLPPLEQRRALAMQDSAVQAQIAAQYATAYSASLGEIPPEVATNMIVSAAEADPVLKDLLLQFGLIEEGADGTITVNFPDGPTVQQTIIELTASIDALIVALGGIPPVHLSVTDDATPVIDSVIDRLAFWDQSSGDGEATLTDNASSRIAAIASRLAGLDASSASPYATVSDNATGTLQNIQALLNSIDGRTATTYVKTVYQTYGSGAAPPQGIPGFTRQHGGILGFAGGGVMFRGAEAGPELLHYASGGSTPIYHDGLYTAPANTYVSPANANPGLSGGMTVAPVFNNYAPIYGVDDLNNRFRDFAVTLVDDLNRHRTAAGV